MTKSRKKAPRVQLPYLIRDRQYLRENGDLLLATPLQTHTALDDGSFQDGPVHQRVAIIDLDAKTRRLRAGAKFKPQGVGKTVSCYDLSGTRLEPDANPEDFETDSFFQVSTFATVLKVLDFFEGPEILGREIAWAFPSEQLLVVPRAGEMENAYYDRASGSLQFFQHQGEDGFRIYTALSHDIVAHEATHAVLDGIAPDLYNAITPQSLALHEALADVAAITQTLLNKMVVFSLHAISSAATDPYEALSKIAEEFGTDTRRDAGIGERGGFLRRMKNQRTLAPEDTGVDEFGDPNYPDPTSPHALSEVLSGAIYAVYEMRMRNTKRGGGWGTVSLEDIFLPAARRVSRIVFRALDYLPPGDASFADYGRAFLAAARTTYKRPQKEQEWLIDEFVRRRIVDGSGELSGLGAPQLDLQQADFEQLLASEAALQQFAETNRAQLGIPKKRKFTVMPPVIAARSFGDKRAQKRNEEIMFRFRWQENETHDLGTGLPRRWAIPHGTTMVVERGSGKVLSCLTTDTNPRRAAERRALLKRWANEGRLMTAKAALGPDGMPLTEAVIIKSSKGVAQAEGGGRTLHITKEWL